VIPPVGESLPNTEIFRRLAARFGFTDPCFTETDEQLMDQALPAKSEVLQGRRASELSPEEVIDMSDANPPGLLRGLPPATPSGRIELYSEALEEQCGLGLPRYRALDAPRRFILVTPDSERRINSTFGGVSGHENDLVAQMHPDDAGSLSLHDGEAVNLHNEQGEVHLPLQLCDRVRPGTICVPKGAWLRGSPTGQTVNALIPGHRADLAGGACYYDCTVDVSRCS
jgi:anaerobic selenocysteine-containing dehydrogenase